MDIKESDIKIGKTVIETLTQGMYQDSRFIFREYVQNSADAIDKAVENKLLESRKNGEIHIRIDKPKNTILFEDNGAGIKQSQVFQVLGNIALSEKDRTRDKGFRGIGRLGGLGYCEKLIFETSYFGENVKTVMTWDSSDLRLKLFDKAVVDDASEIVKSIISIRYEKEELNLHYFKVILEDVDNDDLLNIDDIKQYFSMVAPISFSESFFLKTEIYKHAQSINYEIDEYTIYLNEERIFKPYKTRLYEESMKQNDFKLYDEILDINFFDFYNSKNEILGWIWYGISRFEKQIPKRPNFFRGIRLRKGNIEIGDEQTLLTRKLPREERANGYFIGEIYCVHSELIPNSRRDYFNENDELKQFEQQVKELFHGTLHDLYYTASNLRGAYKKVNKVAEIWHDINQKEETGFIDDTEKDDLFSKLTTAQKEASESLKKIDKIENITKTSDNSALKKVVDHIKDANSKAEAEKIEVHSENNEKVKHKYITDDLSSLPKEQRKFLARIFVIIKNNLIPDQAEQLIQKIKEELR